MKYHSLGGLNNLHLFLIYLESGKSKIKAPTDPVSSEISLMGLLVTIFLVYPYMGGGGGRGKLGERKVGREEREGENIIHIYFSSSVSSYSTLMI